MLRRTLLAAAALGAALPPRKGVAQTSRAKTLKFIPQADLTIVDPWRTTAFVTRNHGYLVFDTLYGLDDGFVARPQMVAGDVVSPDGLIWDITLRDGLRFHDGTPVLGRDVVASLTRWGKRDSFGQALFAVVDEFTAPSDAAVRFRLRKPFPRLREALAKLNGYMPAVMPARIAGLDQNSAIVEMVGSGPFRFIANERVPGSLVVYEKFAGYAPRAEGVPSRTAGPKVAWFDRVEWHVIPDSATAAAALATGEVDWVETPSLDLIPMLRGTKGVAVRLTDTTGNLGIMRLNQLMPPFDNPALRRAVLHGVRQSDFMSAVAGTDPGAWRDSVGYFCPDTPLAQPLSSDAAGGQIASVRRQVMDSGYNGSPVTVLGASDFPAIDAMSQVGRDMLQKIGMVVDFNAVDWGTVQQRRLKKDPREQGGWNVFFTFAAGADALNPAVNSSLQSNGINATPGWPTSEKIEALRTAWLSASDMADQRRICAMIENQAEADVPYIPLGQFFQPTALRSDLTDVKNGFPIFDGIHRGA